jgi:hypothetical protein
MNELGEACRRVTRLSSNILCRLRNFKLRIDANEALRRPNAQFGGWGQGEPWR